MKEILIKSIRKDSTSVIGEIFIDGNQEFIKTDISQEFMQYALVDRIDAFVWGLIIFAIRNGYDIVSDLPITDELKYNLEEHFISSLCEAHENFHLTKISAPIVPSCKQETDIVATGISCGIDSLYTIQQHTKADTILSRKINTLTFFNVGSSFKGGGEKLRTSLVEGRLEQARRFAYTYHYDFLFIESNIHLIINKYSPYSHIEYHTFMMLFCMNLIQPGLSVYYYSSGYAYKEFCLGTFHGQEFETAQFDLLSLFCASMGHMHFYSAGGNVSRLEKTRSLIDYKPAQTFLNVCVNAVENDNICFKCIRTLLSIDALGGLEKFDKVFDVEKYKKNRFWYLKKLYFDTIIRKDVYSKEIFPYFQHDITSFMKMRFYISALFNRINIFK